VGQDAGQKRVWDRESERARKAAYRERKRRAELLVDPELPEHDIAEPDLGDPEVELRHVSISEEEYVEWMVRDAAAYADSIGETDAPYEVLPGVVLENRRSDRLRRARKYAHWRYQGFRRREVATL